jgi:hypothetical protein
VHAALRGVFSDVLVLPGSRAIVLASRSSLARDPDVLSARLRERGVSARLVRPEFIKYVLTNDRVAEIASLLASSDAPANSDSRPVCYLYTMALWLARLLPGIALSQIPDLSRSMLPWLLAALGLIAAVLLVLRRRDTPRRAALAGVAGFSGMVLESVVILAFQSHTGALYQDLGLLLTAFMAGLASGAWAVSRLAAAVAATAGRTRLLGAALLVSLAAAALATAGLASWGAQFGLTLSAALLLLSGALTAALFAFAGLRQAREQASLVAPLYSADLLGGCVGSLAASIVLIPAAGLDLSAVVVAAVAGLGLLLI